MIGVLLLLPISCHSGSSSSVRPDHSRDLQREIVVDGMKRYFTLHLPASYNRERPAPVVLNFHGGGGNSKTQRHISGMNATADRNGFIAVYPQGTNKKGKLVKGYTWNGGGCCGWAQENRIDDVKFTAALLDALQAEFSIDTKRVYATGISNGAIMSYRLACELADRIAAIAPVAGPMEMQTCTPSRPVSVINFHGERDEFAPYTGGSGKRSLKGQKFNSVENTLKRWQQILGLEKTNPEVVHVTENVSSTAYRSRRAEYVLYTIREGGHTWPGGKFGFLGKRFLGEMNMEISANEIMWDFFQRHHLP